MKGVAKFRREAQRRKPLILNGARQVGKTWLLKEFGKKSFSNTAYVSFDNNPGLSQQFKNGFGLKRLLLVLQAESGEPIKPDETLIILDEIQECPEALTSLKYFCENGPDYAIAAAGSLLGLSAHKGTGYPVGKVVTLNLYPLHFREFLDATGNQMLRLALDEGDFQLLNSFQSKFELLLRQYYYVGGMPEAVHTFIEHSNLEKTRAIQNEILLGYERDISKHLDPRETEFALAAWNSIPAHLSQKNKKIIFGHITGGARAKNYRFAITWLTQAAIATRVSRITKPGIPLSAYVDEGAFKLFLLDIGLLGAMTSIDKQTLVSGNALYTEFKGALTEQYVCQQLISDVESIPYYWSARNSQGEIDFLIQKDGAVNAIEVKAEENLRAKSLRAFSQKYKDVRSLRFSLAPYRDEGWMKNIPLWAIGTKEIFSK